MALPSLKGLTVVVATDESKNIPEGFIMASLINTGDASATITQNGQPFTLIAGGVFDFPILPGNDAWKALIINATGTVVECVSL